MYHGGEQCSIDQKPPLTNLVPNHGTRILSLLGYYGLVLLFGQIRVFCSMSSVDWNPSPDKYISVYAHYYYISHIMSIYTCVTPCIFTCNYLRCLNACQWRYGLQTFFRTWLTSGSVLFNYLIDGYCHLLFICYTLITQYYHNITQLGVKCLHLIRYITLPNRGPHPL